jgi:hypothetical protein
MLAALFLLVGLGAPTVAQFEPRSVSTSEFVDQAARCGVSLTALPRDQGYRARLSEDGRTLTLRGDVRDPRDKCMADWGSERKILVIFWRD